MAQRSSFSGANKIEPITIAEVEELGFFMAKRLMEWDESIPDFGSRFPGVLESCVATPFQSFAGKDLYGRFVDKASILFYLMNKNHPFENGNKRIAVTTLFLFLFKNGKWLSVDHQQLYEFAKGVAASKTENKDRTIRNINRFLNNYMVELRI